MRINPLVVSLVAFAACADAPPTGTADHAYKEVITTVSPLTKQLSNADAVKLCGVGQHLPTIAEMTQQVFADCATTSRGFACIPLAGATDVEVQVWTQGRCEIGGVHGFFVGSFGTGEITCVAGSEAAAQPLCLD